MSQFASNFPSDDTRGTSSLGSYVWLKTRHPEWASARLTKRWLAGKRHAHGQSPRAKRAVKAAFASVLKRLLMRERARGAKKARIATDRLGPGIRSERGLLMLRMGRKGRRLLKTLRQGKPEPRVRRKTERPAGVVLSYSCDEGKPPVVRLHVARKRLVRFQR